MPAGSGIHREQAEREHAPRAPEGARGPRLADGGGATSAATSAATASVSWQHGIVGRVATWALVGAAYFLAGKLGLSLAFVHPSATPVWPPTGIALAVLLRLGIQAWPGIFAGAFLVNLTTAGTFATSLGIASGNTLEGLIGAYLVRRFAQGDRAFDRAPDVFRFAILAGVISTAVSATVGVTSLAAGGVARWADFGSIWFTWWLGDMGGDLVVAPTLILWSQRSPFRWTRARLGEAALLFAALLAVGYLVFGSTAPWGGRGYPLEFLCIPPLVWMAFRLDPRASATATCALSAIAVWGTLASAGPFDAWEPNESLLLLQTFMAVVSVATLCVAATVSEKRRSEEKMRAMSEDLSNALSELEGFSHAISHDLRSPIGAVMNYAAVVEQEYQGRLDDQGMRIVRRIQTSAESAARLIDQLVHFARTRRGDAVADVVDMTALARAAYDELSYGSDESRQVQFELRMLPPAPGSEALLGRVFSNLLSNAVKFTRGRSDRRIEVTGEAGERENTYRVVDNGVGFSPETRDALFEPLQRRNGRPEAGGQGLGLAIVAKIIRRHGGRIWAESDGTHGSRFTFTLPIGKARS